MENTSQKKCTTCYIYQTLNNFTKAKANKDGYFGKCKVCTNITRELYRKTKNGIIGVIYSDQRSNAKKRNYKTPNYSIEWLREWLFSQDLFHELYKEWKDSKYIKDLKPSVDRKNDYKSYTKENIQLMTYGQNRDKFFKDLRDRKNLKPLKAVCQYNADGILIKEYVSISDAETETGCHNSKITSVCKGNRKTTGGFIWKYK